MLCVLEIAMLVAGFAALTAGRIKLGRNRIYEGGNARLAGFILMLPLPVSFIAGLVVGADQAVPSRGMDLVERYFSMALIELGIILACALLAILVVVADFSPELVGGILVGLTLVVTTGGVIWLFAGRAPSTLTAVAPPTTPATTFRRRPPAPLPVEEPPPPIRPVQPQLGQWARAVTVSPVTHAAITPNGRTLITVAEEGRVFRLYDLNDLQQRDGFPVGSSERVLHLALSPDGRRLAAAGPTTVTLCDPETGRGREKLACPGKTIQGIAFSPDSRSLAAALGDTMRVWNLDKGQPRDLSPPAGMQYRFSGVQFTPDGRKLFSAGTRRKDDALAERADLFWDVETGAALPALGAYLEETVASATLSPDGSRLALHDHSKQLRLWDLRAAAGATLRGDAPIASLSFGPDARTLATGHHNGVVRFWDSVRGVEERKFELRLQADADPAVTGIWFTPDGYKLVTATNDDLRVWDLAAPEVLGRILKVAKAGD